MNGKAVFRPGEREFAIQVRSLLLKCVDLLERQYLLGKYKPSQPAPASPTDTIAGIMETGPRVNAGTVDRSHE